MPTFSFKVKGVSGQTAGMGIDGAPEQKTFGRILHDGRFALDVKRREESRKWLRRDVLLILSRVKKQDLLTFTRQLRALLAAGVPVLSALRAISKQTQNRKLKNMVEALADEVAEGQTLSGGMLREVKVFGEVYVNSIRGGEVGGTVVDVLERLSEMLEHDVEMAANIKSAVRYPIMVVVALFCSVCVLMSFVVPKFAALYARFQTRLPLATRSLIGLSAFFSDYWAVLLLGVPCVLGGFHLLLKGRKGRRLWHKFLSRVPVFGELMNAIAVSRFAGMTAMLERSGLPITRTLKVVAAAVGNTVVGEEVEAVLGSVEEGQGLSPRLASSRVFPPMVAQMVAVGEKSGTLETVLEEVSRHFDDEVKYKVRNLTALIEPMLLGVLASAVLGLMLAIFLPLWDMVKLLKH